MNNVLITIPARAGSKGIYNKNMTTLKGQEFNPNMKNPELTDKPLLFLAIDSRYAWRSAVRLFMAGSPRTLQFGAWASVRPNLCGHWR